MGVMKGSGQKLGEEATRGGGGLRRDIAGRGAAELCEKLADIGDVGGFGEERAVVAHEMGFRAVGKGRRQVGGVGFEEEMTVGYADGIFAGAGVFRPGEGAAEGDEDVFRGEGGEGVGGTGIGVDQKSGGMRGGVEQDVQHGSPSVAAMQAGGEREFARQLELGAEDGFAVGVESVAHARVESDLANAGRARGEDVAQILQPAGAAILDEPRVDAERADDAGIFIDEGADGGPVGLGGGVDVEQADAGRAGADEDLRKMGGQARVLQMAVGVGPGKILRVRGGGGCYVHK